MKRASIGAAFAAAALAFGAPSVANAQFYNEGWSTFDRGVWGSENWGEDRYGAYDQDFGWGTDDEWFGREAEGERYGYGDYDDAGDGGWFDV